MKYLFNVTLVTALTALAVSTNTVRAQPRGMPRSRTVLVRDAWVPRALEEKIDDALESGQFGTLAAEARAVLMARVRCGQLTRPDALADMVFMVRAAAYLPIAQRCGGQDGEAFAQWLWENRPLGRVVFRAMGDVRDRSGAMQRLFDLFAADRNLVARNPQLAAAICTVIPLADQRHTPPTSSLIETFKYYTGRTPFRRKPADLPFEISRYIVDSRLSEAERTWAVRTYIRSANPIGAFRSVPYDTPNLLQGRPKRIEEAEYSLLNLRKLGGTCQDKAWFAVQVAKSVGVPAAILRGRDRTLVDATWAAGLTIAGRRIDWDAQTARPREHQFYLGTATDAASGMEISDAELMLTAASIAIDPVQREQSDALAGIAMLVQALGPDPATGNSSALTALAEDYKKPRKHTDVRPRLETGWFGNNIELGTALVEELLLAAIDKDFSNRRAWRMARQLAAQRKLSDKAITALLAVTVKDLASAQADYACDVLLTLPAALNDIRQRDNFYRQAIAALAKRPDLQGRLLIAIAEDYVNQNRRAPAVQLYTDAVNRCANTGPVGMLAATGADAIYAAANRTDLSLALFTRLFSQIEAVPNTSPFYRQSPYFLVGSQLESMLRTAGKEREAEQIRIKIQPAPAGGIR